MSIKPLYLKRIHPLIGIRYAVRQQADLIGSDEVPSIVLQATLNLLLVVFLI